MRQIYIDTYAGLYHPCEVESFKYNKVTDKYILYFFDRSTNDYCVAPVTLMADEFFCGPIELKSEEGFFKAISSIFLSEADITLLPPYLKSLRQMHFTRDDKVLSINSSALNIVKKLEFLEVKSYANALIGPIYYYFIINDMKPRKDGFDYDLTFSEKSLEPLNKNIIAKQKTEDYLEDICIQNQDISLSFPDKFEAKVNMRIERIVAEKIIGMNEFELDPILLTKAVRKILNEKDYIQAAREYQRYLDEYFNLDEKEKSIGSK